MTQIARMLRQRRPLGSLPDASAPPATKNIVGLVGFRPTRPADVDVGIKRISQFVWRVLNHPSAVVAPGSV